MGSFGKGPLNGMDGEYGPNPNAKVVPSGGPPAPEIELMTR